MDNRIRFSCIPLVGYEVRIVGSGNGGVTERCVVDVETEGDGWFEEIREVFFCGVVVNCIAKIVINSIESNNFCNLSIKEISIRSRR